MVHANQLGLNIMKLLIPLTIIFALLLNGCAQQSERHVRSDAGTYSSVAVSQPNFKPMKGQSFAWYGKPVWSDSKMANANTDSQLVSAMNRQLADRGYRLSNEREQADYVIGMALITEGGTRNEELAQFFSIFPNLPKSAAGFKKGVIAVGVITPSQVSASGTAPDRQAVLWRSALEAFILDEAIDENQREERIRGFVSVLMKRFP